MTLFGLIGFGAPWVLVGLAGLPVLWILLRVVPPAPMRHVFPAVQLLFGLKDEQAQTRNTPWWLILLRAVVIASLIIGFAQPVWKPKPAEGTNMPLLVVMDGTWAEASDWSQRVAQAKQVLQQADRAGRDAAVFMMSQPSDVSFTSPKLAVQQLAGFTPQAYFPERDTVVPFLPERPFETHWIAAPLSYAGQRGLAADFLDAGPVTLYDAGRTLMAISDVSVDQSGMNVRIAAMLADQAQQGDLLAYAPDPNGQDRVVFQVAFEMPPFADQLVIPINLPPELRNRVTRFALGGGRHAGAVHLTDDSSKRREIAILGQSHGTQELSVLLSQTYYLTQALAGQADLIEGALHDVLQANPDVVILADVATISAPEQMMGWIEEGGTLVRFAGPRLAASLSTTGADDPFLPTRLRAGGRSVGGAMSWGAPKTLQAFAPDTPFYGLQVPDDLSVTTQVLAEPSADLSARVVARLSDGTPLVTMKQQGQGRIVLFHVTANADWSNLPLTGLFIDMLRRLSLGASDRAADITDVETRTWQLSAQLDGYGKLRATADRAGIAGTRLVDGSPSQEVPAGLYNAQDVTLAHNVMNEKIKLTAPNWPAGVRVIGPEPVSERPLIALFLTLALVGLMIDVFASMFVSGRLRAGMAQVLALGALSLGMAPPADAQAQTEAAFRGAHEIVLAYVRTGDVQVDRMSQAGLFGLSQVLYARTSVEPGLPAAVDIARDDISLYPVLYWPILPSQNVLGAEAAAKVNRYLRGGGVILFDTRDADISGFGRMTPEGQALLRVTQALDIPPLARVPEGHVLRRSFYLLDVFPGRYASPAVWVEAPTPEQGAGAPDTLRNRNDGVTPIVIGGNDWAAAWAVGENGAPLAPIGDNFTGGRQREMARRFGVNLVIYALTGNYKADQVHIPDLLERLGQP